ncbi:hypothetical protein [Rhodophyticola porphyridii]|uniref:hypothetical protein n=1 Tax=Rhodophyticola porphyridii TaxID=1852017 RepID=UPI0035D05B37
MSLFAADTTTTLRFGFPREIVMVSIGLIRMFGATVMTDETHKGPQTRGPANDNEPPGPIGRNDDDADSEPRQKLDAIVLSIAGLIGRQMAREQFEALRAANDNAPPAHDKAGPRAEDED